MKIYLDMDGVMVNFVKGAIEAANLPIQEEEVKSWDFFRPFMTTEQFWDHIHSTYEFWEGLEPYPEAFALYELCCRYGDVTFLSDSSHDDNAPSGKVKWLRWYGFLDSTSSNYMLGRKKHLLSGGGWSVLIDDSPENCWNWNGRDILYPRPWNMDCFPDEDIEEALERASVDQWLRS